MATVNITFFQWFCFLSHKRKQTYLIVKGTESLKENIFGVSLYICFINKTLNEVDQKLLKVIDKIASALWLEVSKIEGKINESTAGGLKSSSTVMANTNCWII